MVKKIMKLITAFVLLNVLSGVHLLCTSENCTTNCRCFSTNPPNGLRVENTPQLVTLTFDDGVNAGNYPTYLDLLMTGRVNKGDNCSVKATFFVTHDYTNYRYVNRLYRQGSEIAVHSISHSTKAGHWEKGNASMWKQEIDGMRTIISNLAIIPKSEIRGVRAPFLETAGDVTFRMLKENGFTYDSSMPSRVYSDLPIWPYTLDHGYAHDCQIPSCPKDNYPGLWLLPMVNWKLGRVPCAMVDACTPTTVTVNETLDYMKENFIRHYESNRAPFPVYLHQSWLQHEARRQAYFQFVDWMLEKDDVFLVTANEVIEYMKNPLSVEEYRFRNCSSSEVTDICQQGKSCYYEKTAAPGGSRYMEICSDCPAEFPWTGNPEGLYNNIPSMRIV